jgi:hypothetical protein
MGNPAGGPVGSRHRQQLNGEFIAALLPDAAGLIGAAHLVPSWVLKGYEAILAVDVGGINIRAGIVELNFKPTSNLSKASVWKFERWRHADDRPSREEAVRELIKMLQKLIARAEGERLRLAPFSGIGCPGHIEPNGAIDRGAQGAGGTIGSARVAQAHPRWLYAACRQHGLACRRSGAHSEPEIRFRAGFRADRFHGACARGDRGQEDFPARDLREFVAYLKKNGESVKQAHGGIGASSHMACLLFNTAAGTKPTLVAYRGTAPAMNDLVGGHVDFFCEQVVSVAEQIAAGTIKAYGVSASERLAPLPNVPTAKEAGVNYQMSIWAGIFAPKGTPREITAKLASALDRALDDPGVKKRLTDLGGSTPVKADRTPAKFATFVQTEVARWSPILKEANVEAK